MTQNYYSRITDDRQIFPRILSTKLYSIRENIRTRHVSTLFELWYGPNVILRFQMYLDHKLFFGFKDEMSKQGNTSE